MTASPTGIHDYRLFGLKVRSEIELPELFPGESDADWDVVVTIGDVASPNHDPGLHSDTAGLLLVVADIARFRIAGGKSIVVEPTSGVPERNVRLFLLGSAFGALLHQRGLLPLHANAIEIDGRGVAFMGPSGSGKSTLAAWLNGQGHRLIADDVCVVGMDEHQRPYAAPGLPRLRLWVEALRLIGRNTSGYQRSYVGPLEQLDKFDVPIDAAAAIQSNTPLAALYVLEHAEQFSITRLDGVDAAEAVFANTYRGGYVAAADVQLNHWKSAVNLVRSTPVYRAARKWDLENLGEQCSFLLEHARGILMASLCSKSESA